MEQVKRFHITTIEAGVKQVWLADGFTIVDALATLKHTSIVNVVLVKQIYPHVPSIKYVCP